MTRPALLATFALLATGAAVAGAAPAPDHATPHVPRVAVVAAPDASAAEIARAEAEATQLRSVSFVTTRRVGGAEEARSTVTALAAAGYDVVAGAGPSARAAITEARSTGPATDYVSVR